MLSNHLALLATLQSQRFHTDFKVLGKIGKGGFSKVYKVSNILDKSVYAIKKIDVRVRDIKDSIECTVERVQREARYLSKLSHSKIIRYFNSWVEIELKKDTVNKLVSNTSIENNDLTYDNYFTFESPILSKNDLDNIICFEAKAQDHIQEQISYYENDEQSSRIKRNNKKNKSISNKKSSSQECRGCSEDPQDNIDKIVFYIQTELCNETLEIYLSRRDAELYKMKKKSLDEYNRMLLNYDRESLKILRQVTQGLSYLHNECKLVHRDLKPGNIFMNSCDDVKIGDFGLVTRIIDMVSNQDSEECMLSPIISGAYCTKTYASPEQVNLNTFDQRSDVYALGLIILQLFHPMGTSMEIMKTMQDARKGILPSKLRERQPKICEIILDCLNHEPKERPQIQKIIQSLNQISLTIILPNEVSPLKVLGNCLVQFEDDESCERFLTYNKYQIQIYKSQKHQKAQMIYNISECTFQLKDEQLNITHNQLVNLSLKSKNNNNTSLASFYQYLIDKQ